jgi:hypothetical protein
MAVDFWFVDYVTILNTFSASTLCPSRPTGGRIFGDLSHDMPVQAKCSFEVVSQRACLQFRALLLHVQWVVISALES